MRLIDSVLEAVNNSPSGTTTEIIANMIYGDLSQYTWEQARNYRCKINSKARELWRQGYIMAIYEGRVPHWYPFNTDIKEAML